LPSKPVARNLVAIDCSRCIPVGQRRCWETIANVGFGALGMNCWNSASSSKAGFDDADPTDGFVPQAANGQVSRKTVNGSRQTHRQLNAHCSER
jgi:hypothetical protein